MKLKYISLISNNLFSSFLTTLQSFNETVSQNFPQATKLKINTPRIFLVAAIFEVSQPTQLNSTLNVPIICLISNAECKLNPGTAGEQKLR